MEKCRHQLGRRATMMVAGILLIGISVGLLRLAAFGVDPFSCMNMGISGFLGMSFGNWQLIDNILLLIVVFFTARSFIGLGTVVNMVFVGYIADFVCWLAQDAGMESPLALRIALLLVGIVMTCAGAGIYMAADLGIAPYDAAAYVLLKAIKNRIAFRWARIITDFVCVGIGTLFCLLANNELSAIVGVGTIITAFLTGPLIQFFRVHVAEPLLGQERKGVDCPAAIEENA
ncbi:hypothetical protein L0P57_11115 [Anaeromassilibacillus senegalensis]|uniref:YitT family protein n=1 Tax=Anaeromassilibacillus senegalensis TaxID=1673717 RepID=A0ABS9ML87_9FIRM|nr:hypothetical protein [Anaeromassilibacillus senegalensis]MCG4611476.1 hypothetical protein [Anaeromassilibacillus senegalensis]